MSEIVVRPYEPRDQEATWNVRAMTYNSGRPIPIEKQVYKTSAPFVGEVDGKVVGTFVIMDMTCTRGDQGTFKTGGIAGVAVLPEARQTGVGAAMMRWALRHMREAGYVLAALYAFRESYYRKFGYEVCGMRYRVNCPNARLPRNRGELVVRRVRYSELAEIKPCYTQFARMRGGMNLRQDLHWGRIIIDDLVRSVYVAGNPVEAYAILEHDETFWNDQQIAEFAWTTERGYDSMVSFFAQLAINKASVSWNEPGDSPFLARYADQGVHFESEKPIMFRLLDVQGALRAIKPMGAGQFSVAVHDVDIPENNGPWAVSFGEGKTMVEPAQRADFTLDIKESVQALLGQPSLSDLLRNGSAVGCPESAERLLPPLPVYCIDHF